MLARTPPKSAPELEIKFQLGAGAAEALQRHSFASDKGAAAGLHAIYYDTPDHALRDAGFSLRVRRKGEVHTQTLKHRAAGGLFERDEWERQVAGPDLDLDLLAETPAASVAGGTSLGPVFTVEVERRIFLVVRGGSRIEVSFDTGLIAAGDRHEAVSELELELLSGPPEPLFDLARELQSAASLALLFESKAERGYRLAGHDGVAALRARDTAVGPETTGASAFQLIARSALVQVGVNARLLQRAHNPEILHQLRVGLRRLRAAFSAFKPMLDAEGLAQARAETRWLAGELAEARDIDVFLQKAEAPDDISDSPGRAAFFRALRMAQAEAYERALTAVGSERFRTLLFAVAEWIEAGRWRNLANDRQRRIREEPVAALAASVLARLDRRLRRRSRKFSEMEPAARHDLRKQAKKLRYATAFFGGAFPKHPRRLQRYSAALKALQDQLGELNDMAVARGVARRAVGRRSGELAFAAGLEVGRLTQSEGALIRAAETALKAFRKAKPFWPPPDGRNEDLNLSSSGLRSA